MLQWHRDDYIITGTDAAQTSLGRFLTPSGILHDPQASQVVSQRVLWDIYQIQAWPIHVTTGNNKHGLYFQLCLASGTPGGFIALPTTPEDGVIGIDGGIRYKGPPLIATHGIGWFTNAPALVAGDHVFFLVQYNDRRWGL
jgi:hypothetical protein